MGLGLEDSPIPSMSSSQRRRDQNPLTGDPVAASNSTAKPTPATLGGRSELTPGRIEPLRQLPTPASNIKWLLQRSMSMQKTILEMLRRDGRVDPDTVNAAFEEYNDIHRLWMAEPNFPEGG